MTFSGPVQTVAIGNRKPRPISRLRTYINLLEHPVAGCGSKLAKLGGSKRTDGYDFGLCLPSQFGTILEPERAAANTPSFHKVLEAVLGPRL